MKMQGILPKSGAQNPATLSINNNLAFWLVFLKKEKQIISEKLTSFAPTLWPKNADNSL
jgi:hypothetical protein